MNNKIDFGLGFRWIWVGNRSIEGGLKLNYRNDGRTIANWLIDLKIWRFGDLKILRSDKNIDAKDAGVGLKKNKTFDGSCDVLVTSYAFHFIRLSFKEILNWSITGVEVLLFIFCHHMV